MNSLRQWCRLTYNQIWWMHFVVVGSDQILYFTQIALHRLKVNTLDLLKKKTEKTKSKKNRADIETLHSLVEWLIITISLVRFIIKVCKSAEWISHIRLRIKEIHNGQRKRKPANKTKEFRTQLNTKRKVESIWFWFFVRTIPW